jgi:hypothetical protein
MRRIYPALATVGLIIVGMFNTTWGVRFLGRSAWALPDDLWATMIAAQRLLQLHVGGLYTPPTGLVSFPGTALILVPVVAVMDMAGISMHAQSGTNPQPVSWLLAGPYSMGIACVALFAADALAERMGTSQVRRGLLALTGAIALWSVTTRWGHPEDAVAVGLLLYGILSLDEGRRGRAGWLTGAALLVQPLVVLALPVILVAVYASGQGRLRGLPGFCVRAGLPSVMGVGIAAVANWHATYTAITSQPNFPGIDHPTPWTSLSPHLAAGEVAAGPGRLLAIGCACACGVAFAFLRGRRADALPWLLWWVAVSLALRCVFESVMVAYYLWPALQVALIVAVPRLSRLIMTCLIAAAVTFGSQAVSHGPWLWWSLMTAGLVAALLCAFNARPASAGDLGTPQLVISTTLPRLRRDSMIWCARAACASGSCACTWTRSWPSRNRCQSSSRQRAYSSGLPLAMAAIWNPMADALLASSSYASTVPPPELYTTRRPPGARARTAGSSRSPPTPSRITSAGSPQD